MLCYLDDIAHRDDFDELLAELFSTQNLNKITSNNVGLVMIAASFGQLSALKMLVEEKGCLLNETDSVNNTVVHMAAFSHSLSTIKWLVDEKNCPLGTGHSAAKVLSFAIGTGEVEIVKWLVNEKGLLPTTPDELGQVAVHEAAFAGWLDILRWLIEEKDCSPYATDHKGRTLIDFATLSGGLDIIKWLIIEKNFFPDADQRLCTEIISSTIRYNDLEFLKLLVNEKGFSLTIEDESGRVAVHEAAWYGLLPILQWLIEEKGCSPYAADHEGKTLIDFVHLSSGLDIIKWLIIEKNFFSDADQRLCAKIIFMAIFYNDLEFLKLFVDEKQDRLDVYDVDGNTPVLIAARYGRRDILSWLVFDKNLGVHSLVKRNSQSRHAISEAYYYLHYGLAFELALNIFSHRERKLKADKDKANEDDNVLMVLKWQHEHQRVTPQLALSLISSELVKLHTKMHQSMEGLIENEYISKGLAVIKGHIKLYILFTNPVTFNWTDQFSEKYLEKDFIIEYCLHVTQAEVYPKVYQDKLGYYVANLILTGQLDLHHEGSPFAKGLATKALPLCGDIGCPKSHDDILKYKKILLAGLYKLSSLL